MSQYKEGQYLILESGEYSGRFNIGLYKVKVAFSYSDMDLSDEIEKDCVDFWKDPNRFTYSRKLRMRDDFIKEHLEEIEFEELNTDFMSLACDSQGNLLT